MKLIGNTLPWADEAGLPVVPFVPSPKPGVGLIHTIRDHSMLLVVDFSAAGNSAYYRGQGWSGQERDFVWAVGGESRMSLPAVAARQALTLELAVNPALAGDMLQAQPLTVWVNGTPVGMVVLRGRSRVRFQVDPGLIKPNEPIALTFEHPGFVRMDWLGHNADDRHLAISFLAVRFYTNDLRADVERIAPLALPHEVLIDAAPLPAPASPPTGQRARTAYRLGATLPTAISLRSGWLAEADTCWTMERVSRLILAAPIDAGPYLLRIRLQPLVVNTVREDQRLSIILNDRMLGQFRIGQETVLGFPLPADVPRDEPLALTFVTPDGVQMGLFANGVSGQVIGFAVHEIGFEPLAPQLAATLPARTDRTQPAAPEAVAAAFLDESLDELPTTIESHLGVSLTTILKNFESLGDNCGFGLVQRKGGVEVLGLLRFANTRLPSLLQGLDDEFRATTVAEEVTLIRDPGEDGEYMLWVPRYGIRWHTMVRSGDPNTVFQEQTVKLRYLCRKFFEGLRAGRKIYTIARSEPRKIEVVMPSWSSSERYELLPLPLGLAEASCVLAALNRDTPNVLLYLVPSCDGRRSGTVERLAPGLLRGHLDSFVVSDQVDVRDHADWLRLVGNAWSLLHGVRQDTATEPHAVAA